MSETKDSEIINAPIRCRLASCNTRDTNNEFIVCPKCKIAKYCSQTCLKADADLHSVMCDPTKLQKRAAAREQHSLVRKVEEESVPDYLSEKDMDDSKVIDKVVEQIQMVTDPFVVYQHQLTRQRGFLFLQSESTVKEFRHLKRHDKEGKPLNRTLVCHYMTLDEFTNDVCAGHPNDSLRDPDFVKQLKHKIDNYDPKEHFVVLSTFGCGTVHLQLKVLSPFKLILDAIKADKERYRNDSLDINIDQE